MTLWPTAPYVAYLKVPLTYQEDYYSPSANSTSSTFASAQNETLTLEAEKICPPLIWAQVGIMGGLWLILLVVQGYFL
jgi:hypothetical protein